MNLTENCEYVVENFLYHSSVSVVFIFIKFD